MVIADRDGVVSSCGLSQYLVSRPNAGRAASFHATFYFTLLGLARARGGRSSLGGPIGAFIHAPGLGRFLPGLAVAAVLERVGTIQDRILVRDMRFRAVGLLRSLGEVVYTVARSRSRRRARARWWGGGNAVVIASIARSAVAPRALSAVTPRREWLEPCRITWARTRELFAFGLPMSMATLAGFGARRWDNLSSRTHFGQGAAGIYNLAYNLADIPATQIGETIGDVLVPSFAQIETDADRRRRALLLSLRQMTLLVAPLAFGLGAVAPALARAFFDRRWAGIDAELALLSVLSAVRPIGWIGSSYLQVENRPRAIMLLETAKTVAVVVLMHLFAVWAARRLGAGEHWACAAVGVALRPQRARLPVRLPPDRGHPPPGAARRDPAPGRRVRPDGRDRHRPGARPRRRRLPRPPPGRRGHGGRPGLRPLRPDPGAARLAGAARAPAAGGLSRATERRASPQARSLDRGNAIAVSVPKSA